MALTSNLFSIRILPVSASIAAFQLTSASGGSNLPFTIGHAFKKGNVPAGASVTGNLPGVQVVPKNVWPDGSLKFALVSGRATLTAGVPLTVALSLGPTNSAPPLTTDDLRATSVTAAVGAGSFGSVSWANADWSAPFMNWVSGPQMSSWIYRKPVGSDPHLVAWLELRLYAGGAVEILPWIEAGYLNVPGPTSKSAVFTFALGGTQRFSAAIDLPHQCRTVLTSGAQFSHWLGAPPAIIPNHDKAYLQTTRLVPAYRASVPSTAWVLSNLAQTYTPLQRGNYSDSMGQTGYHEAIGLLPEWDVLYLTTNDARAYAAVIVNAYGAGRYGIHFRDETTLRPIKFSAYPNLVTGDGSDIAGSGASTKSTYTPTGSGTRAPVWDTPHHPSVGFMAYLVTGRFYFMEEVQFSATVGFLKNTDSARQFSDGVFLTNAGANTTRGAAWSIRTLAQAACITPDNDTLRAEFVQSVAANVDYYHTKYVAKQHNPFGFVTPYSNYAEGSGKYTESAWMEDFFTAATGYVIDLDLAMPAASTAKLSSFFAWKAQNIIGRLGGTSSTEYLFSDAAVYTVAVAPTESPDFTNGTGPWYANWGEIYAATQGKPNPGVAAPLRGAYYPDATSYWANLQPAIAYAVQHNVAGAQAAYNRMVTAPNWNELVTGFNSAPVWSVAPHN
jgi:hypothetical protein